jgi:hypothetical protein
MKEFLRPHTFKLQFESDSQMNKRQSCNGNRNIPDLTQMIERDHRECRDLSSSTLNIRDSSNFAYSPDLKHKVGTISNIKG